MTGTGSELVAHTSRHGRAPLAGEGERPARAGRKRGGARSLLHTHTPRPPPGAGGARGGSPVPAVGLRRRGFPF